MSEPSREQTADSTAAASANGFSKLPEDEVRRLLSLRHHDPHSILGAHPTSDGVIVRANRPGARKVFLIIDGKEKHEMRPRPEEGLFEISVNDRRDVFHYQLELDYGNNRVFTVRSPYAFLPTLGELDRGWSSSC